MWIAVQSANFLTKNRNRMTFLAKKLGLTTQVRDQVRNFRCKGQNFVASRKTWPVANWRKRTMKSQGMFAWRNLFFGTRFTECLAIE